MCVGVELEGEILAFDDCMGGSGGGGGGVEWGGI